MRHDFRPIVSEQTNHRNIVFFYQDKFAVTDISYDSRWYFLDWQDDIKGYYTEQEIYEKMDKFRETNQKKLDELKDSMKKAGII